MNFFHISIIFLSLCSFIYSETTTLFIDPSISYQTIEGWGISLAWWANIAGAWPESITKDLIQKSTQDLNMNIFRFNIGGGENPNCPWGDHMGTDGRNMPGYRSFHKDQEGCGTYDLSKDKRQITIMDRLAESRSDILTEVFSYSPPWWMTNSKCTAGETNGS